MKTSTLVDSNVLIDVLGPAHISARIWSLAALKKAFETGPIILSAIVWAELARPGFPEGGLTRALAWLRPRKEDFPFAAASAAGVAHRLYRARGGSRERTLPDFLIGAHAAVAGHALLTRDRARYASCFPTLTIISPETHP